MTSGTAQRFGRAPGYPLFLAALDAGRPRPESTPARVKVAQSIVGALTVWLIGVIAWRAAGARAGIWAAAIAAIYPPLVTLPAYTLSETVFSAVALASALVIQLSADRATQGRWRWSRTRGDWWRADRPGGVDQAGHAALPATRRPLVSMAPSPGPCRDPGAGGHRSHNAVDAPQPARPREVRAHRIRGRRDVLDRQSSVGEGRGRPCSEPGDERGRARTAPGTSRDCHPKRWSPSTIARPSDWIAGHPLAWAELLARKLFYTVVPIGPSYAVHSARYRVASAGPYVLVLPFAIAGVRRLLRSPHRPTSLLLLAASSVLVGLMFFPQERFRMPVIDPVIIIAAAALAGRSES